MDKFIPVINTIVLAQEKAIKQSFTDSKIRVMNDHNIELFSMIVRLTSHSALTHLTKELERMQKLMYSHYPCGCRLYNSCGLPCACKIQHYLQTEQPIPIKAIDLFWRKLDFTPAYILNEEHDNFDEEFSLMKEKYKSQPEHVKKSWMKKLKEIFTGVKTDKKQPNVVKNTRGRPRKTNSTFHNEEEQTDIGVHSSSVKEVPRHSSYVPSTESGRRSASQVDSKKPKLGRSQSVTSNRKGKEKMSEPIYIPGDEEKVSFHQFSDQIPKIFHRYIKKIVNVLGDGNCGFRAIATGIGGVENEWPSIRSELLMELNINLDRYVNIFHEDGVWRLQERLTWAGVGFAPEDKWFTVPPCAILAANRFHSTVVSLSLDANFTVFPMWVGPYEVEKRRMITLVFVNKNHFIRLELEDYSPMPPPSGYWKQCSNKDAKKWEEVYELRLRRYLQYDPHYQNKGF